MKTGDRIGPYVVLRFLGEGAMGEVVLATHPGMGGQRFAIKLLARDLLGDEAHRRRFEREMEALAALDAHPGIVRVYSAGVMGGAIPYIVMGYVEGSSLEQAQKVGALPFDRQLEILLQVARALGFVHARGFVHRDVKPANILLDEESGRPLLADFGLARLAQGEDRLTRTGDVLGTPHYMAPELIKTDLGELGPTADVYSLGVMLYHALTGQLPFKGATAMEVLSKVVRQPVASPSSVVEGVHPELERVCLRALARRPTDRYPDGDAFADDLAAVLRSARAEAPSRLVPLLAGVAAISIALGAIGIGVSALRTVGADSDPDAASTVEAAEVQRVRELIETGDLRGAIRSGEQVLSGLEVSSDARALRRLIDTARVRLAQIAFRGDDPKAALDHLGHVRMAFPELPWILMLNGEFAQASAACPGSESVRVRARLAALAVDEPGLQRLLGALEESDELHGSALREELAGSPEGRVVAGDPCNDRAAWDAQAQGHVALRRGWLSLATLAFHEALKGEGQVAIESSLGLARVELARGRIAEAQTRVGAALQRSRHPIDRARCLVLRAQIAIASGANGSHPDVAEAVGYAPGWPEMLDVVAGLAGPQAGAANSRQAWVRRQGGPSGSWVVGEGALCAAGRDGEAGLLLARGATLGRMSEIGNDHPGARLAEALLEKASRLRPRSPSVWVARSRAARVLHKTAEAEAYAKRALALAPGDPAVLLEGGLALLGVAEAAHEDSPFVRSELARVQRVSAEEQRELDEAYTAALGAAIDVLRWAISSAERAGTASLLVQARLTMGRALLHQARTQTPGVAKRTFMDIRKGLAPVIAGVQVRGIVSARRALAQQLMGQDPRGLRSAEDALADVAGGVTRQQLEALSLLASTGGDEGALFAQAYLGAAADLPARALYAMRRAELLDEDSSQQSVALARAVDLAPGLPAPLLMRACLQEVASSAEQGQSVGAVLERAPEYLFLLMQLQHSRGAWDSSREDFARELELEQHDDVRVRLLLARAVAARSVVVFQGHTATDLANDTRLITKHHELGRRATLDASEALSLRPDLVSAHLLRATGLSSLGRGAPPGAAPDDRLAPDLWYHLACARAGAPYSGAVTLAEMGLGRLADLPRLIQEHLAKGNIRNALSIYTYNPDRLDQLRAAVFPIAKPLEAFDFSTRKETREAAQMIQGRRDSNSR